MLQIGGNKFYDQKNEIPMKILELKKSGIGIIAEFRGIPTRFPTKYYSHPKPTLVLCPHKARIMNNMEWVLPNPLVGMTVEELRALRHQLKNIAKNLEDLIRPEWSSALDIFDEIHKFREAVDDHSLNQRWFSVHARVDGTVMMVTSPEIHRVSQHIFAYITQTLWLIVMHYNFDRIFCWQSLLVLMPLILNMRQTA
jgi:hypothetical protein